MEALLKFLIHKMRTLDGTRGSAERLLKFMQKKEEKAYMEKTKKDFVSESIR